jgi:formamidopyrimidine-DNA glycosylase
MPEGPELRHSRDVLRKILKGKSITSLKSNEEGRYGHVGPESMSLACEALPLLIEEIDTKGKFMWWTLQGAGVKWYLWSTYGMSGQWTVTKKKHAGFEVEYLDGGSAKRIYFVDPRHFGTIKFVKDEKQHIKKLASLGPDILVDPPMTPEIFAERVLLKPSRTISEALMDQRGISGVGNYLKAEALYRAKVSPRRVVSDMTSEEILSLWSEVVLAARESYADHGASIRTYKTVEGSAGHAQFHFRVYNQKTCPLGHNVLSEETLDKRTSWWCKTCQR